MRTAHDDDLLRRLGQILRREAACKRNERECAPLQVRDLFFEPNHETIGTWQRKGLYTHGIDRRVVFICESPSDRRRPEDEVVRSIGGQALRICWDLTDQDERFLRGRKKFHFEDCLITNAVKCGARRPSTDPASKPTTEHAERCSRFLIQELELIRPIVVACLGHMAFEFTMKHALPALSFTPLPVRLTHYSFHGTRAALFRRWAPEFALIDEALRNRHAAARRRHG